MVSNKTSLEMVIETEHKEWLDEMVGKHALKDTSKAVRVLLNYAIEAGSEQEIFEEERCRFCQWHRESWDFAILTTCNLTYQQGLVYGQAIYANRYVFQIYAEYRLNPFSGQLEDRITRWDLSPTTNNCAQVEIQKAFKWTQF